MANVQSWYKKSTFASVHLIYIPCRFLQGWWIESVICSFLFTIDCKLHEILQSRTLFPRDSEYNWLSTTYLLHPIPFLPYLQLHPPFFSDYTTCSLSDPPIFVQNDGETLRGCVQTLFQCLLHLFGKNIFPSSSAWNRDTFFLKQVIIHADGWYTLEQGGNQQDHFMQGHYVMKSLSFHPQWRESYLTWQHKLQSFDQYLFQLRKRAQAS